MNSCYNEERPQSASGAFAQLTSYAQDSSSEEETTSSLEHIVLIGDYIEDQILEVVPCKNYEGLKTHYKPRFDEEPATRPGGAGLVAAALATLSSDVATPTWIYGPEMDIKQRVFQDGKLVFRMDPGALDMIGDENTEIPDDATTIIVVDYGKGAITPEIEAQLRERVYSAQFFVHSKHNPTKYADLNPIYFTNQREWPVNSRYPGLVVQTLGARGATLRGNNVELARVPSKCATPNTVVGAGDWVMAGFIDAVLHGGSYKQALEWSQVVAAEACKDPYGCWIEPGTLNWKWYYGGN